MIIVGITILYLRFKPSVDKFFIILRPANIQRISDTRIPERKLPSPNAYDFYIKAENLIDTTQLNAYLNQNYRKRDNSPLNFDTVPYNVRKKLVQSNQKAYSLLREGLKYQYMAPRRRYYYGFQSSSDMVESIARILIYESSMYASEGKYSNALKSRMDCYKLSAQISEGGNISNAANGIKIQNYGEWNIFNIISSIDEKTAKQAAKQMIEIDQSWVSLPQTLQGELWSIKRSIIGHINSNTRSIKSNDRDDYRRSRSNKLSVEMMNRFLANSLIDLDEYFNKIVKEAQKPYPLRKVIEQPSDPVSQSFSFSSDTINFSSTFAQTKRKLLILHLALRAYYLEAHEYPDSLTKLSPKYLPQLPTDPFTNAKDFKYIKTASNYILYSIGPDLQDNGGEPMRDRQGQLNVRSSKRNKGDIVIGMWIRDTH